MPPLGHPTLFVHGQNFSELRGTYYSNEDIDFLHGIIEKAQSFQKSTDCLPTEALFSAYFSTLARYGVNSDHDNRYARILFRIGGLRGKQSLFKKFEYVLSGMGIEIEFERTDDEQAFNKYQRPREESASPAKESENSNYLSTPKRRSSESFVWDVGVSTRNLQDNERNNSVSSVHFPLPTKESNKITQDFNKIPRENSHSSNLLIQKSIDNQRMRTWLAARSDFSHNGSLLSHASLHICKDSTTRPRPRLAQESLPVSIDYHAASTTTALTSPFEEDITTHSIDSVKNRNYLDSETIMNIKASLIINRRLALFLKPKLQVWKNQALQLQQDNEVLELIANNQYRKTVFRAALHNWRIELIERKKAKDIERYFNHLQGRATRARDLYLLYLAFSHWSNFTAERCQQNERARNHIIRTRIFNAWREITAVDEMKVRRQVLKRYFSVIKLQYFRYIEENSIAIIKYENDLIKKCISVWKQSFLESRASFRWSQKSKHSALSKFISKFRSLMQQQYEAEINVLFQSKIKLFRKWKITSFSVSCQNQKAELYRNHLISRNILLTWSKATLLVPLFNQLHAQRLSRQIKKYHYIWLRRTREELKASRIDLLRILHEAWISWRHKTRAKVIKARFDSNKIERALYKWILQARSKLAARVRNEICLRDMMYIWKLKWQASRKNHWDQESLAHEILDRKTQNLVLLRWYSCMGNLQQARQVAVNFYRPRILKALFRKWTCRLQHLKKLNLWSQDARYYLLSLRILRQWKNSTEISKRSKRKMAYIQVRRSIKLNLARRFLKVWVIQTQVVIDMQSKAADMSQSRAIIIGMEIFDLWRSYAEESLETKNLWREKLLRRYFSIWKNKMRQFMNLEAETSSVYRERQISRAINKWNLKYLNIRARTKYASDIQEKTARRNFRRIFNFWCQQARDRLLVPRPKIFSEKDFLDDVTRNETWSELGGDNEIEKSERNFDGSMSIVSIPGYLKTPSKRSERIMAAAAKYSTTPKIPLPTLYERELRAMWSRGPNSSLNQKIVNKSRFGMSESKDDPVL